MLLHAGVQFMPSAKCCTLTCNEAPPVMLAKLSKRRETMSMANRWLFSELWLMGLSALRRARREKSACVTLQEAWRRWGGREWGRDWEFLKLTAELGEGVGVTGMRGGTQEKERGGGVARGRQRHCRKWLWLPVRGRGGLV